LLSNLRSQAKQCYVGTNFRLLISRSTSVVVRLAYVPTYLSWSIRQSSFPRRYRTARRLVQYAYTYVRDSWTEIDGPAHPPASLRRDIPVEGDSAPSSCLARTSSRLMAIRIQRAIACRAIARGCVSQSWLTSFMDNPLRSSRNGPTRCPSRRRKKSPQKSMAQQLSLQPVRGAASAAVSNEHLLWVSRTSQVERQQSRFRHAHPTPRATAPSIALSSADGAGRLQGTRAMCQSPPFSAARRSYRWTLSASQVR